MVLSGIRLHGKWQETAKSRAGGRADVPQEAARAGRGEKISIYHSVGSFEVATGGSGWRNWCRGPRLKGNMRKLFDERLGYEAYTDEAPFDPSMMVHFRKRLNESILAEINELIVDRRGDRDQNARRDKPADDHDGSGEAGGSGEKPGNAGMLLMDASLSSGRHPVSDRPFDSQRSARED
jgi:hypothetical protein